VPFSDKVRKEYPDMLCLLQIGSDETMGIHLDNNGNINLMMKPSDLKFGNWKKTKAYLHGK
jgi:hypothetical protein